MKILISFLLVAFTVIGCNKTIEPPKTGSYSMIRPGKQTVDTVDHFNDTLYLNTAPGVARDYETP